MTSITWSCKVEKCESGKHEGLGYCRLHYRRFSEGRPLEYEKDQKECQVTSCDKPSDIRGYCSFHYLRKYSGVPLDAPKKNRKSYLGRKCFVGTCENAAGGERGLCKWHSNWSGKYGFSVAQVVQILNSPYLCEICDSELGTKNINIDHDHECCPGQQTCGKCIRGLLCRACNRGIGSFNEKAENVLKAVEYLMRRNVRDMSDFLENLTRLVERMEAVKG